MPPRRVRPDQWTPIGVDTLEANATTIVRSADNRSVIAGPGAGKTELLALRAAFLFQAGTSPPPRRILAISFKRDAATNLPGQVGKRCHRSHAGRRQAELGMLRGIAVDDEASQAKFARELDAFVAELAAAYPAPPTSSAASLAIVESALGFIDRERLLGVHPAYA